MPQKTSVCAKAYSCTNMRVKAAIPVKILQVFHEIKKM